MGHQNIQTTLRYQKVTSQCAETLAKKAFEALAKDKQTHTFWVTFGSIFSEMYFISAEYSIVATLH